MTDSRIPGVVYMPEADIRRYERAGVFAQQTLSGAFRQTCSRFATRTALSEGAELTTFAELDATTDRGAAALWRLGLRPTDRVLFQMRNCKELVYAFLSCLKIGVIPVCTLAAHREQEIGYIGRHTEAKAHFVHGDDARLDTVAFARTMMTGMPSMRHVIVVRGGEQQAGTLSFESLMAAEDGVEARSIVDRVPLEPRQVALFQLSGGTSGIPKIIPRFNNEYLYAMQSVIAFIGLSEVSIAFTPNPFMHNAPMSCFWGPTLLAGGEITVARGPTLADIEAALQERRPNWLALAKVHLLRLIESGITKRLSFDHVKAFAVPDSAKALSDALGARCIPMYGMTEGLLGFCSPADPEETLEFTVGRSTSVHDEIRIVRPGTQEDLPEGEVGELLVRGPCTIRGYYNAPDRDAEAFTADGFYRSGDLMSFRTVQGVRNLVFQGRVKDVVDRGGEKINCSEVELSICQHADVGAAACVAMPDPLYGERMCAFIVLREGAPVLDIAALGTHLSALGLAKFKWPERIELVSELPTTTSGKVSKPLMRELIANKLKAERQSPHAV